MLPPAVIGLPFGVSVFGSVTDGTGSGVASSTLIRETATLSGNTCGTFGNATTVANNVSESGVPTECIRYTLDAVDNVGNNATTFQATVKVDRSAPDFGTPALTLTAGTNAFVNGTTVYTNNAGSASFSVSADNVADPDSGILGYTATSLKLCGGGYIGCNVNLSRTRAELPGGGH